MAPDDQPDLDPRLADAVRDAYVRPIDGATARAHVRAIVAAASGPGESARRRRGRGWRAALAGATAAVLLPPALAVAGVALPNEVERGYGALGIKLSHKARDAGPAPRRPAAARPSARPTAAARPTARPTVTATPTPQRPARHANQAGGRRAHGSPAQAHTHTNGAGHRYGSTSNPSRASNGKGYGTGAPRSTVPPGRVTSGRRNASPGKPKPAGRGQGKPASGRGHGRG